MNDRIDKLIARFRLELHEGQRKAAVERRKERNRQADARVRLAQIEDRITFHMPQREQQPSESNAAYAKYVAGLKLARQMVLLRTIAELGAGGEDAPVNELGERLDF